MNSLRGTKTGATRLGFAILLKAFQLDGRFPDRREDVAGGIVAHLASQTGVPQEAYFGGEWSERTQRYQRALIREHCGFRAFRAKDGVTTRKCQNWGLGVGKYRRLGDKVLLKLS